MRLDSEACWRAFESRDRRFEGRFVAGVRTTGIYCRPGCPARLPKRSHLSFYICPAAAEEAGFRPCLRCRPDATPGSPAWLGTSATVRRALRLIGDGALDHDSVESLAARLGVGDRHLRRLFAEQLGASPLALARTRRVHFARRLIEETRLPMTEIALAAGFESLRRFNHTVRDTFRRAPRELRRLRDLSDPSHHARNRSGRAARASRRSGREPRPVPPAAFELRLPARAPFDGTALLEFLAARAIPGVELVRGDTYRRTISVAGAPGMLAVRVVPREPCVRLLIRMAEPRDLAGVAERVTRLFDLAADTRAIAAVLRRDPVLAPALRGRAVRVPGAWDPFEITVRAILGQQVTVAGARTLAARLVQSCGATLPGREDGLTHLFPTPAALADTDLSGCGVPRARAEAIRGLARAVRDGAIDFAAFEDLDDAVTKLTALKGIGRWTAHYVAMRALGEPDAFPAGDLGVRRALAANGRLPEERQALEQAEAWRPWRAYAVMALWTSGATRFS